jgi:hypothetical protein
MIEYPFPLTQHELDDVIRALDFAKSVTKGMIYCGDTHIKKYGDMPDLEQFGERVNALYYKACSYYCSIANATRTEVAG